MSLPPQTSTRTPQGQEREFPLTVVERADAADGVVVLDLASPEGHNLPAWSAGAHIDLVLGEGLVRQYSLCGNPADRQRYRVAVLREPEGRGGSAFVHDQLVAGSVVGVTGPRNHFALSEAEDYLFIAGGIGITPILAMITEADRAGRPWRLAYGGRSRASMAFCNELGATPDRVQLLPQDEVGLLPLAELLAAVGSATAVYCCGPEPLLAAVEAACTAQGILNRLHVERFAPKPLEDVEPNTTFEVQLARSGQVFTVPPDQSILDVVESAGIALDSSCRDGTCATCEVGVLEGEPDHRDSVLSPAEQEAGTTMMVCVSRCRGARLVLDL